MNGTVVAVLVTSGQAVEAGQTLLVMEAMKMEYAIKAPADGVVNALFYAAGDLVKDGAELVDFTAKAEA
jgi:3-methylcrotonyl-CoA carboxylase alpha subunit